MFKWIPASQPPNKDTFCFVARKREDSSIFIPRFKGSYTTGTRVTIDSPLYVGFQPHDVAFWLPIPEHYVDNKKGWIRADERYPEKDGEYIVCTYSHDGKKGVRITYFEGKRATFLGEPDVIAWMNVPMLKENNNGLD